MKHLKEMFLRLIRGLSGAVLRFPLTVLSLFGAAGLICYMISIHKSPPLIIEKLMFTFLVGAFLGMAAQFATERFVRLARTRPLVNLVSLLLTAGYSLIIRPAPEISPEIGVRTFVAVFALLCLALWFPSVNKKADFNLVALVHFKSFFTSVLYSGVLSAGIAAILAAIDILLFKINRDSYAYMMTIVWVLFATLYYLSLLPYFNTREKPELEAGQAAGNYPKFLEILVSFIAIPLVGAYTLVLLAYFIKILVTFNWPSGQLGPMVLVYSAAGLIIFVLAGLLENRFAVLYRKIFPKALIPVVIMQLVSVGIRLNAYGITESRYYVALFGIFSIATGLLLSFKPTSRNNLIALLAACFAVFSVIPPLDAFTVSRNSQIGRVEQILQAEGILMNGKLTPKAAVSEQGKIETTNILFYLENRSSLKYINWLPQGFNVYQDMKKVIGFEPAYPTSPGTESQYYNAAVDPQKPVTITGYDVSVNIYSDRFGNDKGPGPFQFAVDGTEYILSVQRISKQEARVSIRNLAGTELIGTGFYDFAQGLPGKGLSKESVPPEKMTLEAAQNGYKLKVVFQNINITYGTTADSGVDYSTYVLFGAPDKAK